MRAISGAAVFSDATHIENGIRYLAHLTTKIGAAPRAESPATTDIAMTPHSQTRSHPAHGCTNLTFCCRT